MGSCPKKDPLPCLLMDLDYEDYEAAEALSLQHCEVIAELANLSLDLKQSKKPGKLLIDKLDKRGLTVQQYKELLKKAKSRKKIDTYYKPQAKVAIIIASDGYIYLPKLPSPSLDCDSLASSLKKLDFLVITLKNCLSKDVKVIVEKIYKVVPEKSYCFIFYAGHGCEVYNTKYMLDIQCPCENITTEHCITENFVLAEVTKCKPDLCVFIMDMCRLDLDSAKNPQMYSSISAEQMRIEDINNLLIIYTTQPFQSAYEFMEIEMEDSILETYERQTGDTDKIIPGASQYVHALCARLADNLDIIALLDKVHADVENPMKTKKPQKPIKVQSGVAKRSLYDPVKGDTEDLLKKLHEIELEHKDYVKII